MYANDLIDKNNDNNNEHVGTTQDKRNKRQFLNDLENIPIHLTIFWASFMIQMYSNASGQGSSETFILTFLILFYTCSRILYTLFYFIGYSSLRLSFYFISLGCVFVTSIFLILSAFDIDMVKAYSYTGQNNGL
jgi:uncharacterized MAPEG superfamily protein